MVDVVQLFLIFVVTILTLILSLVGIQFYFLLKDLRYFVKKANIVLDNFEKGSNLILNQIYEVKGKIEDLFNLFSFLKLIKKKK